MRLTRLTATHLQAVEALERAVFSNPWSAKALELLCSERAFGFVVMQEDKAAAYGGMLTVLDEGQITNIATHPHHRRRGYAAMVLQALLGEARERGIAFVTLEVRASNAPARALYEKCWFEVCGERRAYYENPTEDAILMRWEPGEGQHRCES